MASVKQVNYALVLLNKVGYPTRYMNGQFKTLGASMRERSGTVEGWLRNMNVAECSAVIDRLKRQLEQAESVAAANEAANAARAKKLAAQRANAAKAANGPRIL